MTSLIFVYNDRDVPHDVFVAQIPHSLILNGDIVAVIDTKNTMTIIKDRTGPTEGQKFDADRITVSIPDRAINVTPKS